jgi:predicted ester cyclase
MTETASIERNKQAVTQIFEGAYNQRRLELLDDVVAPDLKLHTHVRPGPEGLKEGIEGLREMIRWIAFGWPESYVTVEELVGEGDLVTARFTFRGRHAGWLHGNPPSGREAAWNELFFAQLQDGKVAEIWHELNVLGILQQIGVLPPVWEMGRIPRPLLRVMKVRKRIKLALPGNRVHGLSAWRSAEFPPPGAE